MEYEDEMLEEQEESCEETTVESNNRGISNRRHNDRKKKVRRKKIVGFRYWKAVPDKDIFSVKLRYHPRKTNNKGKRRWKVGNYYPAKNWQLNDRRRIEAMENDVMEYDSENKTTIL